MAGRHPRWQDAILKVQSKKVVLSHGASVYGLPALRRVPGNKWLDVTMIRVNHTGKSMDAEATQRRVRGMSRKSSPM